MKPSLSSKRFVLEERASEACKLHRVHSHRQGTKHPGTTYHACNKKPNKGKSIREVESSLLVRYQKPWTKTNRLKNL